MDTLSTFHPGIFGPDRAAPELTGNSSYPRPFAERKNRRGVFNDGRFFRDCETVGRNSAQSAYLRRH